jgi:hypothetical protein
MADEGNAKYERLSADIIEEVAAEMHSTMGKVENFDVLFNCALAFCATSRPRTSEVTFQQEIKCGACDC